MRDHVVLTGAVPAEELPAHYAAGDVFAMPCRTRNRGLDVEGLGIVYLEASATGLPVVAGDSGGRRTLYCRARPGTWSRAARSPRWPTGSASSADPDRCAAMGGRGRAWVEEMLGLGAGRRPAGRAAGAGAQPDGAGPYGGVTGRVPAGG